ncbi:MAG: hypothetical protein DRO09_03300 [Thermoprotei archaeon]|nr:MAG: hypothetical protein DRO09_03300 [Thermoprotei archaeon]
MIEPSKLFQFFEIKKDGRAVIYRCKRCGCKFLSPNNALHHYDVCLKHPEWVEEYQKRLKKKMEEARKQGLEEIPDPFKNLPDATEEDILKTIDTEAEVFVSVKLNPDDLKQIIKDVIPKAKEKYERDQIIEGAPPSQIIFNILSEVLRVHPEVRSSQVLSLIKEVLGDEA